jgi:4-amino-4-deoxy-L-arabinose transferase-like glycosyltransferase
VALPRDRAPSRRHELWLVGGLLGLAVVLPLAIGAIAGSLEIPRNDDWSYRHIALGLAQTGRFALDGISETMLIGQVLVTQPLLWLSGLQPWAFTLAGVVFASASVLGAYALARLLLPARDAAVAAGLLAIFPGYLAYAVSYMSDIPAMAAGFVCLALGMVAIRHRPVRMRWLLASAAMGICAFSVREFAIAAPASVLLATLLAQPRRASIWAVALAVGAGCVVIHLWHGFLPGQLPPVGPDHGSIPNSALALSSIAFVVAPAVLIGAIRWRPHLRRFDLFVGAVVGGALVAAHLPQWVSQGSLRDVFLSNLASQWGVPARDYLAGGRPLLFGKPIWTVINVVALVAIVVTLIVGVGILGAHLRRTRGSPRLLMARLRKPAGILVLFTLAVTAGLTLFSLTRPVYDRYYWPLVPPLATLLLFVPGDLRGMPSLRSASTTTAVLRLSALGITAVLATVSIVYSLNSNAFDVARWHAGEQLVWLGVPADEIDAGFEWIGYHATTPGDPTNRTSTRPFYRSWWSQFRECGRASAIATPPSGSQLVGTIEYDLGLLAGPTTTIYLFRFSTPGCDQP